MEGMHLNNRDEHGNLIRNDYVLENPDYIVNDIGISSL
jgi:hypothetical protein